MFDRQARIALALLCVTMTAGSLGLRAAVRALNVHLTKKAVPLRRHFDNIPTVLPGWHAEGETVKFTAELVEELGTDLYLSRDYARDDDPDGFRVGLHIAYYTGMIDAVPHVPDRCLVAGGFNARSIPRNIPLTIDRTGWRPDPAARSGDDDLEIARYTFLDRVTRAPVTVHMPAGEFRLRTTEFSHEELLDRRVYAGYLFIANGRIAATPEEVKLMAFRKSERYAYYCKVQFFTIGARDLSAEQFAARSGEFLEVLLPELMRCLPDWVEVQSRSEETNST